MEGETWVTTITSLCLITTVRRNKMDTQCLIFVRQDIQDSSDMSLVSVK